MRGLIRPVPEHKSESGSRGRSSGLGSRRCMSTFIDSCQDEAQKPPLHDRLRFWKEPWNLHRALRSHCAPAVFMPTPNPLPSSRCPKLLPTAGSQSHAEKYSQCIPLTMASPLYGSTGAPGMSLKRGDFSLRSSRTRLLHRRHRPSPFAISHRRVELRLMNRGLSRGLGAKVLCLFSLGSSRNIPGRLCSLFKARLKAF